MKGTVLDFLTLATERPELADDLVALASKHGFEFVDEELSEADLDGVAGGTLGQESLQPQTAVDQRTKIISTLSNIVKKISTTQDPLIDNIK